MFRASGRPQAIRRIGVAVLALLAASCATPPEDADDDRTAVRGSDCFSRDRIYSYKPLDDETLIVWSPNRHCAYLVGVGPGCDRLRSAFSIGFSDRDGRICGFADDKLVVGGGISDSCSIRGVEKLTPERLLLLLPEQYETDDPNAEISNCGVTLN